MACRIAVFPKKPFVIRCKVRRIAQFHLGDRLSIGAGRSRVDLRSDMEDDRIVCRVLVMIMLEPVGSLLVYLHIPYP